VWVSSLELLGGRAVGGDEKGKAFVEGLTYRLARGVEERGWRLLHPVGTGPGVLGQDLRRAERVGSCPLPGRSQLRRTGRLTGQGQEASVGLMVGFD
jgi:hypothetical protein